MSALSDAALAYASRGWRVLPIWPIRDGACACGNACASPGKHPIHVLAPNGCHSATTDAAIIAAWWDEVPDANVGIATGQESGLWALDVDPRHGGDASLEALEDRYGRLPYSLRQRTGSGGWHIVFRHPGDGRLSNSSGRLGAGLDVRGDGGYIVAAPSLHISGGVYTWLDEDESVLEAAPNWLLELIGERYADDLDTPVPDVEELDDVAAQVVLRRKLGRACVRIRDGLSRHQTAVWLFQQLRDNRVPRAVAMTAMDPLVSVANERAGDRRVPRSELLKALGWAYRKQPRKADVAVPSRSLTEIATLQSDIERHRAIREAAVAQNVSAAAVRSDVARIRATLNTPPPDDWRSRLLWKTLSDGSQVLERCLHNAAVILECHEAWRGLVWANVFTGETCYAGEAGGPIEAPAGTWSDLHTAQATAWLQAQAHILVTTEVVDAAVQVAAHRLERHPVREYLDGLEWDREPRIFSWLEDLAGADGTAIVRAQARRFLIGAVARIYQPGAKVDHALILEGPQNLGKSTLLSILFAPWYSDDIDVLGSKDSALQLRGTWGLEIPELSAMHRSDVERTKSFISRREDRFRPPYGRRVVSWPRQCVLTGTTNRAEYLVDETGGRRFWGVACTEIDLPAAEAVRDALWAEAVVAYRAGERWWLDSDGLLREAASAQESRFQADAWEDRIAEVLEPAIWKPHEPVTVGSVLRAIGVETARQDRAAQMRVAACLRRLGWTLQRRRIEGTVTRVYERPGQRDRAYGLFDAPEVVA